MKKLIALILLLVIMQIPMSCEDNSCDQPDTGDLFIQDMLLEFGSFTNNTLNPVFPDDTLDYTAAALVYRVIDTRLASTSESNTGSWVSSALACSPVPPAPGHRIVTINITSDKTFFSNDFEMQPGQTLNDFFEVAIGNGTNFNNSVASFVTNVNLSPDIFGDVGSYIALRLKFRPDEVVNQSFNIETTFDDATVLSDDRSVKIK